MSISYWYKYETMTIQGLDINCSSNLSLVVKVWLLIYDHFISLSPVYAYPLNPNWLTSVDVTFVMLNTVPSIIYTKQAKRSHKLTNSNTAITPITKSCLLSSSRQAQLTQFKGWHKASQDACFWASQVHNLIR
uniref:Uncharacterized protein n=2 Tax=Opuntia streptacantha TaxID=393608 RepID=A0A7C9EXG5_OPUST